MADYITKIRTIDGDKQIDYNALANLPNATDLGALPITGGTMKGVLTLKGIVLTEGIDYGSGDPSGGVTGQLYFKKVT